VTQHPSRLRRGRHFAVSGLPFGVSQYTTWPQIFEQDIDLYISAGIAYIEVCEAKLDAANPEPQLQGSWTQVWPSPVSNRSFTLHSRTFRVLNRNLRQREWLNCARALNFSDDIALVSPS
jgi:hypothetical protein